MALYEMRTYSLYVGKMAEATKLYQELGFPALQKGDRDRSQSAISRAIPARSISLCICGSSMMTPIGESCWEAVFSNTDFVVGFAGRFDHLW